MSGAPYTGAERERDGAIARAASGTLYLDEIGDLSKASQVKLLRLLQEQKYYPLGSDLQRLSEARIVAGLGIGSRPEPRSARPRGDLSTRGPQVPIVLAPVAVSRPTRLAQGADTCAGS